MAFANNFNVIGVKVINIDLVGIGRLGSNIFDEKFSFGLVLWGGENEIVGNIEGRRGDGWLVV